VRHLTLAFACATLLLLGVVRCAAEREGRSQAALAVLEANAHKASLAGIRSRAVTDSVIAVADNVTREMTNQVASNRKLAARLDATLAVNDSILSLPPDSVAEGVARSQLARTTEVARLYRDSTELLLGSVERLLASQSVERSAWLAERESNANALQAKDAVIRALERRECRVLGMRCPSRTTVATIAVIATAFVIVR
jgi:hypothetical protein